MTQYSRKDYMDNKCSHNDYYGQFVTADYERYVGEAIGVSRIKNSEDPHFNDIPLIKWDCLYLPNDIMAKLASANGSGGTSLSDKVCVAKAAARMIQAEVA